MSIVFSINWQFTREQLIHKHANAPELTALIVLFRKHFWSTVVQRLVVRIGQFLVIGCNPYATPMRLQLYDWIPFWVLIVNIEVLRTNVPVNEAKLVELHHS